MRPGRPRRGRRRGWRPRGRGSPTCRARVVVPVVAVVPVPVVAPALVPLFTRAPVVVIHGRRGRRRRSGARCQSECGQGQTSGRQRASTQANPRPRLRVGIHARGLTPSIPTQNPVLSLLSHGKRTVCAHLKPIFDRHKTTVRSVYFRLDWVPSPIRKARFWRRNSICGRLGMPGSVAGRIRSLRSHVRDASWRSPRNPSGQWVAFSGPARPGARAEPNPPIQPWQ